MKTFLCERGASRAYKIIHLGALALQTSDSQSIIRCSMSSWSILGPAAENLSWHSSQNCTPPIQHSYQRIRPLSHFNFLVRSEMHMNLKNCIFKRGMAQAPFVHTSAVFTCLSILSPPHWKWETWNCHFMPIYCNVGGHAPFGALFRDGYRCQHS